MITLGVVADTHVPDRARQINPDILRVLREAEVKAILHAGDVCSPGVLEQLGQIAPVYAVRGNRDWVYLRHLPKQQLLTFGSVEVGLIHGHGSLSRYLKDKAQWFLEGMQEERFIQRALAAFPAARIIVFGHIHRPINEWRDARLVFNPGSACCPDEIDGPPSMGLLHLEDGGRIWGEIIQLGRAENKPAGG